MMARQPTTIRLESTLYRDALAEAKKAGLNFSNIVHLLLRAYTEGSIRIGVTQYPPRYLSAIGREADALRRANRKGRVKAYTSSKALFDDILDR